jgi:hypothetical protein
MAEKITFINAERVLVELLKDAKAPNDRMEFLTHIVAKTTSTICSNCSTLAARVYRLEDRLENIQATTLLRQAALNNEYILKEQCISLMLPEQRSRYFYSNNELKEDVVDNVQLYDIIEQVPMTLRPSVEESWKRALREDPRSLKNGCKCQAHPTRLLSEEPAKFLDIVDMLPSSLKDRERVIAMLQELQKSRSPEEIFLHSH